MWCLDMVINILASEWRDRLKKARTMWLISEVHELMWRCVLKSKIVRHCKSRPPASHIPPPLIKSEVRKCHPTDPPLPLLASHFRWVNIPSELVPGLPLEKGQRRLASLPPHTPSCTCHCQLCTKSHLLSPNIVMVKWYLGRCLLKIAVQSLARHKTQCHNIVNMLKQTGC